MADTPYILEQKNKRPAKPIEPKTGAYYYVFTGDKAMNTYPSASAIIELPERVNVF